VDVDVDADVEMSCARRPRFPFSSFLRSAGGSDVAHNMTAEKYRVHSGGTVAIPSEPVQGAGAVVGGYVGSLDKVQRVSKKLFKRSELAVIGGPSDVNGNANTAAGFIACHFKVCMYLLAVLRLELPLW